MSTTYIDRNNEIAISLFYGNLKIARSERGICGAKTRKGLPCQAPPVWDESRDEARNGRCKLHGGRSTGPNTKAGKEAIRTSNRRRSKIL